MVYFIKALVFAASTAILMVACQASPLGPTHQNKLTLDFIGTINGKSFFTTVEDERRPWAGGKVLCEEFGLQLAKFRDPGEFGFVHSNINREANSGLWISASVKETERGFANEDGSPMVNTNWYFHSAYWLCAVFNVPGLLTQTDFCNQARYKALCQTVTAS